MISLLKRIGKNIQTVEASCFDAFKVMAIIGFNDENLFDRNDIIDFNDCLPFVIRQSLCCKEFD
jgi:hypothetical protein